MEYYSQFLILAYKQKITKKFSRDPNSFFTAHYLLRKKV